MRRTTVSGLLAVVCAAALPGLALDWRWDASGRTEPAAAATGASSAGALDATDRTSGPSAAGEFDSRYWTWRESDGVAFDSRPPTGYYIFFR